MLEEALRRELIQDGVIAASEAQRKQLWALRENPTEAMAHEGVVLRHDIAVPVSRVPDLIERGAAALARAYPAYGSCRSATSVTATSTTICCSPRDMARDAFYARRDEVQEMVFDLVEALGGSISAEHGIGRLKRAELARRKSPVELALMRQLKAALDPKGILNPGAVI